jgi:ribonuclease J
MPPVTLTIFDGAGTIGGNKILLEDGESRLFLDFGTSFSTRALYFEEFLPPRSRRGLLDLVHMGLLPPLRGVYRTDMEDPEGEVWDRARRLPGYRECTVKAVLLSHAHMDHCGSIAFLDPRIPVVCTAMTAYVCKAIQDCGSPRFEGEICYTTPKAAGEDATVGAASKKEPYFRRPFLVVDGVPRDKGEFWNLSPSTARGRAFPTCPLGTLGAPGSRGLLSFPVDHSIHGAAALGVETSAGWVVYTGDFRRHGAAGALTETFIAAAARLSPAALITEGTNIDAPPGPSETEAFDACLSAVRDAAGRLVVADFGPRNVERLLAFLEIARLTGRQLLVMDKDAYLLTAMHAVDPAIPTPATERTMAVYRRVLRGPATWVGRIRSWYPHQVTARQVRQDPGAYILCISFLDVTELIDIDPPSGVWIYSSSEPHNEEQQIDLWRLQNWLARFHLTPVGVETSPSPYHASGHISGPELLEAIRQIRPACVIPVHTAAPHRFREALAGEMSVILPAPGVPITVREGSP